MTYNTKEQLADAIRYGVAGYITGLMQTLRMVEPELVKSVKAVRRNIAERYITFDVEGE